MCKENASDDLQELRYYYKSYKYMHSCNRMNIIYLTTAGGDQEYNSPAVFKHRLQQKKQTE